MKTLKIEMVHDVVCSWCPIGYANLQQALKNLDIEADFYFLPSELNPDMGPKGETIEEHLGRRNQWSQSQLQDYRKHLLTMAEQAGVCIDFSKRTHYYNSNKAHRLIHWSERYNCHQALNELLIEAYFKDGLDISNTQVLLDLAEKLGLDRTLAENALVSDDIHQQLLLKKKRVQQFQIRSLPAFIFNGSNLVQGSNSVEDFEQVISSLTKKIA
jgi:predicted DsbA family dithiol-disulfide isomerase